MNALVRGIIAPILFVGALFSGLSLLAAQPASAQSWAEVVKAAEAEGEVNVHGGPGRAYAAALSEAFAKAYPKIKINYDGGPSREVLPKIIRERQSNIFTWDVFVGGAPSLFQILKPINAFAPLKPALILPEILEDKAWRGGFDAGWMDNDKKYSYGFDLTEDATVLVNWDFVKKADLQTVQDLLKPQFAGKIVSHDPRLPGEGMFTFQTFYLNFGEQFVVDMLTKQKVLYTDQRRQAAEWLVRGQYPIGFATPVEDIQSFQKQGLGKNIEVFRVGVNKMSAGSGFGMVTLMDRAPHPNAAKVYVNWLLSKEGQENWKVTARNSRRMDVTLAKPDFAPPADQKVVNFQAESEIPIREKLTEMAKRLIPTNTAK
jgi:iron(III) transport system substrate-binding protein